MKNLLRALIIAAILLILVFLSIGIVKIIPKTLSSLASATVSVGSIFSGSHATSTAAVSSTASTTGPGGFIIVSRNPDGSTNANGTGATSTRSLEQILHDNHGQPATSRSRTTYQARPGTYTAPRTTRVCTASGSDLAIGLISVGTVNPANGNFVTTSYFGANSSVIVRFKVENLGSCATGVWSMHVLMPSNDPADVTRDISSVNALPGGSSVTGEAVFDTPTPGNTNVVISVSDLSGRDRNGADNTLSVPITVSSGPYVGY